MNLNIAGCLLLLLTLTSCPKDKNEPDSEITIINNSDNAILFSETFSVRGDTALENLPFPLTVENTDLTIEPRESLKMKGPFLRFFQEKPKELYMLYLFDRDTIAAYSWDTIVSNYNILKRYDFNLDSLERRDWIVTYP
jgi:hypothetical protein